MDYTRLSFASILSIVLQHEFSRCSLLLISVLSASCIFSLFLRLNRAFFISLLLANYFGLLSQLQFVLRSGFSYSFPLLSGGPLTRPATALYRWNFCEVRVRSVTVNTPLPPPPPPPLPKTKNDTFVPLALPHYASNPETRSPL